MDNVTAVRQGKRLDQDPAFTIEQVIGSLEGLKRDTDYIFKNAPNKNDVKMKH